MFNIFPCPFIHSFIYFNIFIGVRLLYNGVLSFCFITKWISYTFTYIPISLPSCVSLPPTLPIPPLLVVTKHRADLPVLCTRLPLAIYSTFGSVYMSMPLSHFVPAYPSPSPCPQVHSLVGLRLYSCLAPKFFMTFFFFFRFHIYLLAYGICFSLSDLLHSV